MRIVFPVVRYRAEKFIVVNGKRRKRQKTFEQTVNPFNRNADGSVKSHDQVREDVRAEALAWQRQTPEGEGK